MNWLSHLINSKRHSHHQAIIADGDKVYIRHPSIRDYKPWYDLRMKNKRSLIPWEPEWLESEHTKAGFRMRVRHQKLSPSIRKYFNFLIFKKNNQLLGGINLFNVRRGASQSATIGYWLDEKEHNNGYMSEAVGCVCQFAFSALNLHRLEAYVLLQNIASRQVLERNEFLEEGLCRSYLHIGGEWQDHIHYARLNPFFNEEL